ncbi:hypothetical protein N825_37405 [Skermanella stibiiresistens SB22]|uniref:histidine kinase n=1 Tax=Skermanella stibiiresistens SB22 TaxID=1385369 RepID=W9GTG1_9PROT|nr:sensor histidine kinase [Skermanella stibiiresistens]EWY35712.1 hypothetical protein N825_37405 [Skermanella stibiiresistens SB22]
MAARSNDDLEMALAEAIHRARNDLQAVAAMLGLQAHAATDPAVAGALRAAEERVLALINLNVRLDAKARGVMSTIDSRAFLEGLAEYIQSMHFGDRPFTLAIDTESHRIPSHEAKTLGLILNELVVNALKYAFPDGRAGTVTLAFHCRDGECEMSVWDDGVGLDPAAPAQGTGLGQRMVRTLVSQLGGRLDVGPRQEGGTHCAIRWTPA